MEAHSGSRHEPEPVLAEKLNAALEPIEPSTLTARDAGLPAVPGKAHAVIGMRRAGKTSFLRQLWAEKRAALPPERSFFLGLDDDRLAGVGTEQLSLLLEEYFRRFPSCAGGDRLRLPRRDPAGARVGAFRAPGARH